MPVISEVINHIVSFFCSQFNASVGDFGKIACLGRECLIQLIFQGVVIDIMTNGIQLLTDDSLQDSVLVGVIELIEGFKFH